MTIREIKISVGELANGFDITKYNGSDEDVMCYGGKLNCRPAYQRNFVYNEKQKEEVIKTVFKGYDSKQPFPLNIFYWAKMPDGSFQLLDGQQRTLSLLLFRSGKDTFNINAKETVFVGMGDSYKKWFNDYKLTVYVCEPDDNEDQHRFEDELLEWFSVINIAGERLSDQELRNATHFGPWVTDAKKDFSNEKSKIFREEYETEKYFKINKKELNRQTFLETIIKWKSAAENKGIDGYMSEHRNDKHATDLFNYFVEVLNWARDTFPVEYKEVIFGQDWGRLYNEYHTSFDMSPNEVVQLVEQLYEDDEIKKKDGIVEYILSGKNEKYLSFRQFDESTKKAVWRLQKHVCPMCEEKQRQNPHDKIKIEHDYDKMQGDHIIPWSQGGKTIESNCCMLCKSHNNQKSASEILWLQDYMNKLRS